MESTITPIIVKTYGDQLTVWLSEEYLCAQLPLTRVYMKDTARRTHKCSGHLWRYMQVSDMFYYDYDSIPDRSPRYYRSKLGNKEALIDRVTCPRMDSETLVKARATCEDTILSRAVAIARARHYPPTFRYSYTAHYGLIS